MNAADHAYIVQAMDGAFEDGADCWAAELAETLLDQRDNHGASDARLGQVTLELVAARMGLGLPEGEWFPGG